MSDDKKAPQECPCGYFNDPRRECLCSPTQVARYLAKISGPLLDRIDLQVEVAALTTDEIASVEPGESSASIRTRVDAAREIQQQRFARATIRCNAEMTTRHLRKACELDPASRRLLVAAIDRLNLSARAHDRILKVARTIADLGGCERIESGHVAEAVQYRGLDRAYFPVSPAESGAEVRPWWSGSFNRHVAPVLRIDVRQAPRSSRHRRVTVRFGRGGIPHHRTEGRRLPTFPVIVDDKPC